MKSLSFSQAARYENAKHPRCECRCRGALHGRARLPQDSPREAFEALPDEDPHRVPPNARTRQGTLSGLGRSS